ncbi:MAG: hypothetical protein ABIO02_02685 [Patescibacteria group bacterium]
MAEQYFNLDPSIHLLVETSMKYDTVHEEYLDKLGGDQLNMPHSNDLVNDFPVEEILSTMQIGLRLYDENEEFKAITDSVADASLHSAEEGGPGVDIVVHGIARNAKTDIGLFLLFFAANEAKKAGIIHFKGGENYQGLYMPKRHPDKIDFEKVRIEELSTYHSLLRHDVQQIEYARRTKTIPNNFHLRVHEGNLYSLEMIVGTTPHSRIVIEPNGEIAIAAGARQTAVDVADVGMAKDFFEANTSIPDFKFQKRNLKNAPMQADHAHVERSLKVTLQAIDSAIVYAEEGSPLSKHKNLNIYSIFTAYTSGRDDEQVFEKIFSDYSRDIMERGNNTAPFIIVKNETITDDFVYNHAGLSKRVGINRLDLVTP